MDTPGTDILLSQVPKSVRTAAGKTGLMDEPCLFSARSDVDMEGEAGEVWLIVTRAHAAALTTDTEGGRLLSGPFTLSDVQKVRAFQTVGSAFLQFRMDGLYVDVVRYSNARREVFGRVARQLQGLVEGEALDKEAIARPSELVCSVCGLPLPGRGLACPRCHPKGNIFRRALRLMSPYKGYVLFLLLLMLVLAGLRLLPPYLTKLLLDDVFGANAHPGWLKWILLVLVVHGAALCVVNVFVGRIGAFVGTMIIKDMRERLFNKLIGLNVDYYDRHSTGSLMSRIAYDVTYFQGFVTQISQGFLLQIMTLLGIGVMLFVMDWFLACLVLLPVPLVVVGTVFFWKYIYPLYYRQWDSQSKLNQLLSGLLSGVRLVKSFGQEKRERGRFTEVAAYNRDANRSLQMSHATFFPFMTYLFSLGGIIIWYVGGHQVLAGGQKVGTLIAFIGYIGMFYPTIQALSMFSSWVTGFLSAGHRVFEVLDATTTVRDEENPRRLGRAKGSVELRHVTFGYDPYEPVLKDVSIKIEPGQFVGIVGKSGSGKTTLVNLICRFYDVQKGQVLIDGVDVRKILQHELHKQIGLVLQEPFLFRSSISENITYGRPDADATSVVEASKAANCHEFVVRKPAGYDTRLGERGAGLSGGESQRVSIARALLCEPKILILDEATSSVDTESEQQIQRALADICKGRTTLAIAHRLSTLKNADIIYVIDDGKVAESGSHEELMALRGIYHRLVRIQTELTRLEV